MVLLCMELPGSMRIMPGRGPGRAMDIGKDLVAASATPLVLAILAEGDSYGYAILKRVAELSDGEMEWTDGMLYPVLHRLERLGYVEARWGKSETGRRRRYYRLTADGRAQLEEQRQQWEMVDATLRGIWKDTLERSKQRLRPAPSDWGAWGTT